MPDPLLYDEALAAVEDARRAVLRCPQSGERVAAVMLKNGALGQLEAVKLHIEGARAESIAGDRPAVRQGVGPL